jgi:hypothetical protein
VYLSQLRNNQACSHNMHGIILRGVGLLQDASTKLSAEFPLEAGNVITEKWAEKCISRQAQFEEDSPCEVFTMGDKWNAGCRLFDGFFPGTPKDYVGVYNKE